MSRRNQKSRIFNRRIERAIPVRSGASRRPEKPKNQVCERSIHGKRDLSESTISEIPDHERRNRTDCHRGGGVTRRRRVMVLIGLNGAPADECDSPMSLGIRQSISIRFATQEKSRQIENVKKELRPWNPNDILRNAIHNSTNQRTKER